MNGVFSMAVYNGSLYIGTGIDGGNGAAAYRYNGGDSTNASAFTLVTYAKGQIASGVNPTTMDTVNSLVVHNGALYLGATDNAANAQIYRYDNSSGSTNANWKLISTTGQICGGSATDTGVMALTSYNGFLYAGIRDSSLATICRYDGLTGSNSSTTWTKVSSATSGTISTGSHASEDQVSTLAVYNNTLYAGVGSDGGTNLNIAEVHSLTAIKDQSYALKFNASSSNGGTTEQNGFINTGTISFLAQDSANNGSSGQTNGAGTTGTFLFSSGITTSFGAYDVAEDYPTSDSTLEAGNIVSIDPKISGYVKKADLSQNPSLIGIYSSNPGIRLSQQDQTINGGKAIPVALAGRVNVKVTNENGAIKEGDMLTLSSTPGVAAKATQAGIVIGKALDNFDCPDSSSICDGSISVFVNITWYDPSIKFTATGDLTINQSTDSAGFLVMDPTSGAPLSNTGSYADLVAGNLRTGKIDTQYITSDQLSANTGNFKNLSTDSLSSASLYIEGALNSKNITTEDITSHDFHIAFDDNNIKFTNNTDLLASIDKSGDASFSASLSAQNISAPTGNIDTLTVKTLIVQNLEMLNASSSSILNFGKQGIKTDFAQLDFATVNNGLTVLGPSTFTDATFQNSLSIGQDMKIENNSINTIGQDLEIQPLRQGNISFMAGAVKIESDGTLKVNQNAVFAKDVQVQGVLSASTIQGLNNNLSVSGSATFDKINIASSGAQMISDTEAISTGSAGMITLKSGKTEVIVYNKEVTEKSMIFLTPKTSTEGQTLFIKEQVKADHFTVAIENPILKDIDFNFLIMN